MTSSSDYAAWFNEEFTKFTAESGCIQVGPRLRPTSRNGPVPWQLKWALLFHDQNHISITENFRYAAPRLDRTTGERYHFSFHYGRTISSDVDSRGFPENEKNKDATILRIDLCDTYGAHIHYDGEDHIRQGRVDGIRIVEMDMFKFLRSVHEHRKTGRPLHEILSFTVKPAS